MNIVSWVLARGQESGTWAGLSAIALSFGVSEPLYQAISVAAASVCGLIAVILKEKAAN
jgi:hypothetical protein